jgi:hypothetical protein
MHVNYGKFKLLHTIIGGPFDLMCVRQSTFLIYKGEKISMDILSKFKHPNVLDLGTKVWAQNANKIESCALRP